MYRPLGNRNDEEDADGQDIRLIIKNSQQPTEYIYYTLQPSDTLHNISVRFSCPLAEIRRLNQLYSDQDFYAFTKLKLPVGRLRLITDLIEPATNHVAPIQPTSPTLIHTSLDEQQGGDQIFKNVDTRIESARKAASSYENHASEIMQSLAQGGNLVADDDECNKLDPRRIAQREAETLLNDMTDYGLSYNGLILFVFIVCLICPLAYVIYLEETQHHEINKPHTSLGHDD